jgi:hypothetical protein
MESRSRSSSECSNGFTLNPHDRYLTPVPPKASYPPRLGNFCKESYTVPIHHYAPPKSATYPSTSQSLSPGYQQRHVRSASTSPQISSTALFPEFRSLKEKFTQKQSDQGRSSSVRDLHIGAPTLISTTAEDMKLVSLPTFRPPPISSAVSIPQASLSPSKLSTKLREFSPLGSNPVDPIHDFDLLSVLSTPTTKARQSERSRSRSHPPEITTLLLPPKTTRVRANSTDTRRTKLFSNEPWISSPKFSQLTDQESSWKTMPAPVLKRPFASLPQFTEARPTSSHGGSRSSSLRKTPLDIDKKLPALPPIHVPAPLFTRNSEILSPIQVEIPEKIIENDVSETEYSSNLLRVGRNSHFSLWSADSFTSLSPTSDDGAMHSPTFSSLTSNCSDFGSPRIPSTHFTIDDYTDSPDKNSTIINGKNNTEKEDSDTSYPALSSLQIDDLRLSSFSPGLFLDIQRAESAPRRQAACFGYGFQGYKLPEDETTSKSTITELNASTRGTEPTIKHSRDSSVSELEKLVDEFGFLGDAVL